MKLVWIIALMAAASSFALETYECKDLHGYSSRQSYYIVKIGTREMVRHTEYDDKKICERDAAQIEADEKSTKPIAEEFGRNFVETMTGIMSNAKKEQGWRKSDGTLLWEKLIDGSYYCYDKNGMEVVKRVKEAKWCK